MSKVRVAVIGVGHLGKIHARLLGGVEGAELVGVVDPIAEARTALADELQTAAYEDHQALIGQIDAAIIATPTRHHFAVAHDLLSRGVHVFVEKPMTLNVGDADELIALARDRGLVLQVGHVERFNPAFVAAEPQLSQPKYIDAVRAGTFSGRSTDIGVVLDLMIHDIDLVLALVQDEVASIQALGAAVLGPNEDWAQARLTFVGGCVANLFASRVAMAAQRTMQVIARGEMATLDFAARQARIIRPREDIARGQFDLHALPASERAQMQSRLFSEYLPLEELAAPNTNALLEEQREFVAAIRQQSAVRVDGTQGRAALDVAERILVDIAAHRWEGTADGAVGPRHQTAEPFLRGPHWKQSRPAVARRKAG